MRNLNLLVACFIVGDALALRMALASNRETMSSLMPLLKDCPILLRPKKTHFVSHQAFIYKNEASSSRRSTHVKMPKKKTPIASNDHNISFKTFDASYVLTNKSGKVVAKYVGGKHKGSKTCVWVPKVLVSNVEGPKTVWVPKNKA
jgi:phosphoribosylformylglycinamidine (FGAM) synthase-like amidotransferase family enzyme